MHSRNSGEAAQFHGSSATSRKKAEVAERRRRGTNPADDRPDVDEIDDELIEELDSDDEDDVDDEFDDELDDEFDDEDEDAADDTAAASNGGRRTATKTRRKSTPPDKKSTKTKEPARRGIFFRLINFIREVVAELRKVIWPTRKELITYTAVVVVFVSIMLTIVGLLDYGFAKVVLWVFGNKTTAAGGQ
jgi:preprotein translocase subunit SecE